MWRQTQTRVNTHRASPKRDHFRLHLTFTFIHLAEMKIQAILQHSRTKIWKTSHFSARKLFSVTWRAEPRHVSDNARALQPDHFLLRLH